MKPQLAPLIHIGFHKTGTSWLQDEVFNEHSAVFHRLSPLARHFVFDKQGFMLNSFDKNEDTIINELDKMLDRQPIEADRIPVISYERLSGSPFAAGVNASSNAHRLKSIFPDGKVLIVIRNQREVILSAYFQYLSGGGTHSIKRFLNAKYNGLRPHFTMNHYRYHHSIQGYQHLFGKENVLVLPYELFRGNKEKYLTELGEFINKKIDVKTIDTKVYRNKN